MLKKIFFTFSSKLFTTGINFLIILITARYLGAEGRGLISLLVLGITINLLVSNVFGGAAISYLTPRVEIFRLVVPAYIWAVLSTLLVTEILLLIGLVPSYMGLHLLLLSLLQALYGIHLNVLLGKGQIRQHNLVNALQVALLFVLLMGMLYLIHNKTIGSYLLSLYGSLVISNLITLYFLRAEIRLFPIREWLLEWRVIIRNGYIIQIASIAQLLNYRLSYYILDHYYAIPESGKKMVGIYATAVAIGEALWMIGRSMGLVQYSKIVKDSDNINTRNLTIRYGKISFLLTLIVLLPVLSLPPVFYRFIFGAEFTEIPFIMYLLVPGILSFGLALMYSNYFAGIGRNNVNLAGSLFGLVITLIFGIGLVPVWGMKGAAITASLSYLGTAVYLSSRFVNQCGISWKEIIPGLSDFQYLKNEIKDRLAR